MNHLDERRLRAYFKALQRQGDSTEAIQRKLESVDSFIHWLCEAGKIKEKELSLFNELKKELDQELGRLDWKKKNAIDKAISSLIARTDVIKIKVSRAFKSPNISNNSSDPVQLGVRHYIAAFLLLLFIGILGAGAYSRFFNKVATPFAFPSQLTKADRTLSFQGRLTDILGNPITAQSDIVYKLYNVPSGGTALYTFSCTGANGVTPDQDGIFSTLIGNDCSQTVYIPDNVFTDYPNVYLSVKVGSDPEMTPRQHIANVGYAMNAETLQGFPPGTDKYSIPYINSEGYVLIATSGAGLRSTWETTNLAISSAKDLLLNSGDPDISGGDIIAQASSSASVIRFKTGATDRIFVDSTTNGGNVGIGTTTPSTFKLEVAGSIGPSANNTYDLGSAAKKWANVYATSFSQNGNLVCDSAGTNCPAGTSVWTDGGTYLYPTSGEVLGNSASAGSNKISGIYLADSSPLYFGTDNDVNASFNNGTSTLNFTQGSGDINFDANTLFIDGSADSVGIGTTSPSYLLDVISSSPSQSLLRAVRSGTSRGLTINSDGIAAFGSDAPGTSDGVSLTYATSRGSAAGNTQYSLFLNPTVAPTTGATDISGIGLLGSINQTSTAAGLTRGIYINQTLTSVLNSYRALEIGNNSQFAIYQSGANAKNYFAGNVGIGTTIPGALLETATSASTYGNHAIVGGRLNGEDGASLLVNPSIQVTTLRTDIAGVKIVPAIVNNLAGVEATNYRGLYIPAPTNSGTFTNAYGLYVDAPTQGTTINAAAVFNGVVGIGTTAPGQKLTVDGTLGILEGGGSPSFHTILQGGNQAADVTYTLPTAQAGGSGYILENNGSGTLSWTNPTGLGVLWNSIGSPSGNQSLTMAANTTTWGWTSAGALDSLTANLNNNSGSSTTQNLFTLNNAAVGSFTDTSTESLLLLQQLDTTAAGTTVLANALKVDAAANSGITNGIQVTNSAGNVTTGLLIADTGGGTLTTGISLTGTFTNYIDTPNFDVANSGNIIVADAVGLDSNGSGSSILNLGNTTAITVNLGTTAATAINIGATGALTRTIAIGTGTGADTINIGTGGSTADDINIGGLSTTTIDFTGVMTLTGTLAVTSTTDLRGNVSNSTGTLTLNDDIAINGNTTIGDAITDTITFTGRVAQDADLIPITTTGTNDLGSASLPWDNVYAVAFKQNGNSVCDSTGAGCPASTTRWNTLLDPNGNQSLTMAAYTSTWGWTSTGALDALTDNFNNNSTSSTTQNAVVLNNAAVGSFTDTSTESLVLLQQLDTTAAGTTVLANALKIDAAANSGITNGIQVTNSAGNVTTGLLIADTAGGTLTTGISLTGTFTNYIDAPNFDVANSGNITVADNVGLDSNGAGSAILNLGNTTAATVNLGTTAATAINIGATGALGRTIAIGTGTGADIINIGNGGSTTDDINIGGLSTTTIDLTGITTLTGTLAVTSTSDLRGNVFNSTGTLTLNDVVAINGDTTIGDAITDTITFTGRVAQDADLIPITATGTSDLGTASLRWDNVYAVSFNQNGNLVCDSAGTNCPAGSTIWTDAGAYIYPTSGEVLGNSASAGSNKIAGIYLADSSPLYFGTDNDINASFDNSTSVLNFTQGNNDINFDANTLFIDGSANRVGIGNTAPGYALDVNGQIAGTQGTNAAPSFTDRANGNTGINFRGSAVSIDATIGGTAYFALNSNGFQLKSGTAFGFSSGDPTAVAPDVAFSRGAANKMYVGTGSPGDFTGTLIAGTIGIGITSPGAPLDVESTQTSGTLTKIGAPSAVSLAGTLVGLNVDLSTNYTVTGFSATGQSLALPAVTNTGAGTYNYKGQTISGGALVQNTGAGIDNWIGTEITLPNITQTTGTVTSTGLKIIGGTVTSGTSYAMLTDTNSGNVGIGLSAPTQRFTVEEDNVSNMFGLYDGANNNDLLVADGGVVTFKPTAFDNVYTFDGVSTYANNTTEAKTIGGTPFTLLAIENPSNDIFYTGLDHKFSTIYFDIAQAGAGVTLVKEYWNGSTWTALTVTDNTSAFTTDGTITFTAPSDWATTSVNSVTKYWVRFRSSTQVTTNPTANTATPTTGSRFNLYAQSGDSVPTFYLDDKGGLGIGTTTPTSFKLEVAGSIGPEADNTRDLGSASRRWANIYGTNITGTVTPTGFTTGSVVFAGASGTLAQDNANYFFDDTNNTLGLGTTRSGAISGTNARFLVKGSGTTSSTSSFNVTNSSNASLFFVRDDGRIGIGTSSPNASYKLDVVGDILGSKFADKDDPNFYVDPASSSVITDLTLRGGTMIRGRNAGDTTYNTIVLKGSNVGLATPDTTTVSVCIEGTGTGSVCDGKLDAGTVDPPYTINGKKYATYLSAMTGVKEETTGFANTTEYIPGLGYRAVINFSNQPDGSDLWLFSKTTNLKTNIDKMIPLLSAQGNTRIWYKVDRDTYSLYLYSTKPTTISYRLTAPRFDYELWKNVNPKGSSGFALTDPDLPPTVALNEYGQVTPIISTSGNSSYIYDGNFQNSENFLTSASYSIDSQTQEIVDEINSASKGVFATIQSGLIKTQNAVVKNLLVAKNITSEKIISPVIETNRLTVSESVTVPVIKTNEIQPKDDDVSINLKPQNTNSGRLAKLIIKGLEGKTVATIDTSGNATFSGTLAAKDATISGTIAAGQGSFNEASISGNLIAKNITSDNINALEHNVTAQSSSINDIQQLLSEIQNQPLPDPNYYQNLPPQTDIGTFSQLTVSGNSNLYNLSVSGSALVGQLLIDNNSIISLASELRLSALSQITLFDGNVTIAKDGTITTKGTLIADAGIKTNNLTSINDGEDINVTLKAKPEGSVGNSKLNVTDALGQEVASIDASGSAYFKNGLAVDKYTDATESGSLISSSQNFSQNGISSPAFDTGGKTAGTAYVPENGNEVIIYNTNIKENSLVYLTPETQAPIGQLVVAEKNTSGKTYFKVSIDSVIHPEIKFNWLIIN